MKNLFIEKFIELINSGKFTEEELKMIINEYLSNKIDLEKIYNLLVNRQQ